MPNCKEITFYGCKPHLPNDNEARAAEGLSPLLAPAPSECSEIDSNKSVNVVEEEWDKSSVGTHDKWL
jgi:hypothetical protein